MNPAEFTPTWARLFGSLVCAWDDWVGGLAPSPLLSASESRTIHPNVARLVGSQNAADVTQQVFLQVFRKIDQFSGHSRFETWLYRLAVNEALQHLRKDQRWRKMHSLSHEPMSHHTTRERHEQKELLELALLRTDPDLRAVFILREMEGLSYCEIAEAIDIPEGTVGSRLNRARRELQQHLTDLGWEP